MTKVTNEFRRYVNEAKEIHTRQLERIQRERDTALLAARVVDETNIGNQIPGVEIPGAKKVCLNNFFHFFFCTLKLLQQYCE